MKTLLFIPLFGYLFNLSAIETEFKVIRNDTIYQFTRSKPHDCFYTGCPLKGQLVFYSSSNKEKERYVEKLHFEYPALNREMCIEILKRRDKYVNL